MTFGSVRACQEAGLPDSIVLKRLPYTEPFPLFLKVQGRFERAYMLESVVGPRKLAEYSFIGFEPSLWVSAKEGMLAVYDREGGREFRGRVKDPLTSLLKLVSSSEVKGPFRLMGGAVGYVSYEAIRYWERAPIQVGPSDFPELDFGIYRDGLVFDHRRRQLYYYHKGRGHLAEMKEMLQKSSDEPDGLEHGEPRSSIPQDRFEEMVLKAKDYIAAGDIFQVVLSRRIDFAIDGALTTFYWALRELNPSPYMYYLKHGKRSIIGSSPEMLVRVEGRNVETFPIAGTRPMTGEPKTDARLSKELIADPKDRAEHIMLVDLARNDIGRVAEYGSVSVPELMEVHQFSHVQHLVSHVVARLAPGYKAEAAFRAIFPAGTVSGAPKVRAMEIINELELGPRGPYAGALGYFSSTGDADFAITIRTLIADGRRGSVQVGAGIVADSDPAREWKETEDKAMALLEALDRASGEAD